MYVKAEGSQRRHRSPQPTMVVLVLPAAAEALQGRAGRAAPAASPGRAAAAPGEP